ncbi:oligosaccharide flippase family protein [Fuerstiella marisgermanici]|uniref:Teichuronic acid biosynthesis protein TuaB n=1 Tax=Fuerstiella marisgermanici TaxID=1891926 RepID=A0A1P8WN37_9PLAN|nr:oligosaccharide flippase family protein [Fuerstiella marisgermanici]APZ95457.1 Teichuronic acid biosynthesis protein TuaB [Fuerstiella marisgermanici]
MNSTSAKALRGTKWSLAGAVCTKVVSSVSQLMLAWWLTPEDLGIAAYAVAFTSVFGFLHVGGLHVILVTRRRQFLRTASQAFYVAVSINLALAVGLTSASAWAAAFYDQPLLRPLICICALSLPIGQFALVESAWLVRTMQFRTLNEATVLQSLVRLGGQAALALMGLGAYSILIPEIPAALTRVLYVRSRSRRIPLLPPLPRQWLSLWKDAVFLNLSGFLAGFRHHGLILILGLTLSASNVGLFNWSVLLATQAAHFLAANLSNVFLSMFAKSAGNREQQTDHFVRTTGLLCSVLVPIAVCQALLAPEFITLLFSARWQPGIGVVVVVSIGIALYPLVVTSQALLLAQERYVAQVLLNGVAVLLAVLAASTAFLNASLFEIAVAVVTANAGCSILQAVVALKFERVAVGKLLGMPLQTCIASVPGGLLTYALLRSDFFSHPVMRIVVVLIVFPCSYYAMMRFVARSTLNEMKRCLSVLWGHNTRNAPSCSAKSLPTSATAQ